MALEFDYNWVATLFGIAGTAILLFSSISCYNRGIKNKNKYLLVSQIIGYLFLFDSFIYLLWPKISSQFGPVNPITLYHYWPYYLFMLTGILISLYLVKEKDFGWGAEVCIFPENFSQTGLLISPAVFAFLTIILNSDFLPIANIFAWYQLMGLSWKKDGYCGKEEFENGKE